MQRIFGQPKPKPQPQPQSAQERRSHIFDMRRVFYGSDYASNDEEAPEVQVPEVQVPEVQVPEVQVPEVQVPEVQVPEVQVPGVPEVPASVLPPPVEPYRPEPKFTLDTIVTSNTIIPTCYFGILSIRYDTHEQAHYYTIKSLPQIGEQRQPDITRTVVEDRLKSFEEMRKRHERSESSDGLGDLTDKTNRTTLNTSPNIEVGDEISVRINSTGEKDKCTWIPGIVVGIHSQYGLWECFLVSVDKSGRTMPCTERLLKLVKKGTQSGKKRFGWNVDRVGSPGGGRVRTLRPVYTRQVSGYQGAERFIPPNGICFGDAGKLG